MIKHLLSFILDCLLIKSVHDFFRFINQHKDKKVRASRYRVQAVFGLKLLNIPYIPNDRPS